MWTEKFLLKFLFKYEIIFKSHEKIRLNKKTNKLILLKFNFSRNPVIYDIKTSACSSFRFFTIYSLSKIFRRYLKEILSNSFEE
jgi:hypothetical protein